VIGQQGPSIASGSPLFLLYDGHGSTRGLVDALGLPLSGQIYAYDAYGNPLGFDPAAALTTLLYSGEQLDRLTGLQYLRARYYSPSTGTFNRLDPFAGNTQDPLSLHRYLYTHGDPVQGVDPTGMFEGLVGLLASMNIGSFADSEDASASANTLSTAYRFKRTVEVYQKALKIFNKIQDGLQTITDMIDLLSLDPTDITKITGALAGIGLSKALTWLPDEVIGTKIKLPRKIFEKLEKFSKQLYRFGIFHNKVQEIIGEAGTALILYSLGFKLAPLSIHSVQGPDQVAKHSTAGIWGIFEAKGGYAKLGTGYGGQMSPRWIEHWLNEIIRKNTGTEYGDSLDTAYNGHHVMLAGLVRLNLRDKNGQLAFAFQKFEPPHGSNMVLWGTEWTG
jgi:RHS repeat-associated protein